MFNERLVYIFFVFLSIYFFILSAINVVKRIDLGYCTLDFVWPSQSSSPNREHAGKIFSVRDQPYYLTICNSFFYMRCLICYITVSNKLQNNISLYFSANRITDYDFANYYVTSYVCEIGEKFPETKIFHKITYVFATTYLCYLNKIK